MSPERRMERVAEIAEAMALLKRVPKEAEAVLDRELERIITLHTEKCCDPRLSAEESARHKEARLLARGLLHFFERKRIALREELGKLRSNT